MLSTIPSNLRRRFPQFPRDMKLICLIETIALYIQKTCSISQTQSLLRHKWKDWGLDSFDAKHKQERYLVPQSSVHNDDIKEFPLDAKKLKHDECVIYQAPRLFGSRKKRNLDYDMVVFSITNRRKALKQNSPISSKMIIKICCILNWQQLKKWKHKAWRIDLVAPSKEHPSMTAALKIISKWINLKLPEGIDDGQRKALEQFPKTKSAFAVKSSWIGSLMAEKSHAMSAYPSV